MNVTTTLVHATNGLVASSHWYLLRLSRIFGLCNKSKPSGAETVKHLMQVLLDSSRYQVRNMPLLMQHGIHLSEEQCHVAIKPSPVSNTSLSFQTEHFMQERVLNPRAAELVASGCHGQAAYRRAGLVSPIPVFACALTSLISAALLPFVASCKELTRGFAATHKQASPFLSCLETTSEHPPHLERKVGVQAESCEQQRCLRTHGSL